jgi:hypothetical protein
MVGSLLSTLTPQPVHSRSTYRTKGDSWQRTDDEGEVTAGIARIDQDPAELLVPLLPLGIRRSPADVDIVRPLESHADVATAADARDALDDGEREEVLSEDDAGTEVRRGAEDEGEAEAAERGHPGVGTATAAGDLAQGDGDEAVGHGIEQTGVPVRA